jgi:hypothetical protein
MSRIALLIVRHKLLVASFASDHARGTNLLFGTDYVDKMVLIDKECGRAFPWIVAEVSDCKLLL